MKKKIVSRITLVNTLLLSLLLLLLTAEYVPIVSTHNAPFTPEYDLNQYRDESTNPRVSTPGVPLPIGDPSYTQANPFDSRPSSGSILGLGTPVGAIGNAFDGELLTNINFYYGASASGYAQVTGFKKPSDNGLADFTITFVDIKIDYRALAAVDDQYRIVAFVNPSPTDIILQDWTSFAYPLPWGDIDGVRVFSNVGEPNDGIWEWSDLANLRVRVEIKLVGANDLKRVYLNEVWATAYSTAYPVMDSISVQPSVITNLQVGDVFYVDLYVTNVVNMWGYDIRLEFNPGVLTAIDYFSYGPFVEVFSSEIGPDYVWISHDTYGGDPEGFTGNTPICRLFFSVVDTGTSTLNLSQVSVVDVFANPILLTVQNGLVEVGFIPTIPTVAISPHAIVDPPLSIGEIFAINITISDVQDLYTWQSGVTFNPDVLEALNVSEGEFLKRSVAPTLWTPGNINNTLGRVGYSACSVTGDNPGISGSGQLMSITFRVKNGGNSTLHLADVLLLDSSFAAIEPVNLADGYVQVPTRDIAIISVTASNTEAYPTWTHPINITVIAENQGPQTETFNITAYANATFIQARSVTLDAGTNTSLIFVWYLNGTAEGSYGIRAEATILYGETDTADNTLTDGIVRIKHPGDANGDNVLNAYDLGILAKAWGTKVGDTLYDARADFNGDRQIDTIDHEILKAYWP